MKTITYEFVDETVNAVEVNDELGAVIAEMDKDDKNNDRRETRRHISVQWAQKKGIEIPDRRVDVEADAIKRKEISRLHTAMKMLTPEQRKLVRKVFFKGETLISVAVEYSISYQAIQDRLRKVYRKLRKFCETTFD